MREYSKEYAKDFLKKAGKFLQIAKQAIDSFPEEAAFNAIQSTINANDAFTIAVLGKRASSDHREAIILHKEAAAKVGESKSDVLHFEISSRDATGYDVKKRVGRNEAELLLKRAERFIYWVSQKISSIT